MKLRTRQVGLALLLSALWTLFLVFRGSTALTLEYKWKDHLSNLSVTRLFIREGTRVFNVPKQELTDGAWPPEKELPSRFRNVLPDESFFQKNGEPLYLAWPDIPNPYPPGVYAFFYPISFLAYDLHFGYFAAALIFVFFTLLVAHWTFFIFLNYFSPVRSELTSGKRKFVYYAILTMVYCELCRWPMNGQYETVALPFLILALLTAASAAAPEGLAWYGGALFFHPRSLFYLPLVPFWFYRWVRGPKRWVRDLLFFLLAFLGAGALAVALYMSLKTHNDPQVFRGLNKWSLSSLWGEARYGNLAMLGFVTSGISYLLFRFRYYQLLVLFLWTHTLFLQSAQTRQWYTTLLVPFFFLEKPSFRWMVMAGVAYWGLAQFYPNNSPFEFSFIKNVVESLWDPGLTH